MLSWCGWSWCLDAIGIFQRPFVRFLCYKIIRFLSLMIFTWYLVKMAIQSSSQSFPMEMREPVARLSRMWTSWEVADSYWESVTCAEWVACICLPSAASEEGQLIEGRIFMQDEPWWRDILLLVEPMWEIPWMRGVFREEGGITLKE